MNHAGWDWHSRLCSFSIATVVLTSFKRGRAWRRALPAVVVMACLAGCSQESPPPDSGSAPAPTSSGSAPVASSGGAAPGENRPPVISSARLVANALTRNDTVSLEFKADDPDGDRVTARYQWLANDNPVDGQTSATLSLAAVRRGERVSAELTPVDGRGAVGPAFRTEAVEVVNTPPVVTRVGIEPATAKPGDVLRATFEGSDMDGDPVKYLFEWWRNGNSLGTPSKDQEQRTLATDGFTRGDMIVVGVTPYDAGGPGRFLVSEPFLLLNRAPVITSSPKGPMGQGLFEYTVTASDPDNDPLTYKLDTAPSGMTIESNTGKVSWQMPAGFSSPQQVRISVDDGNQGQAFQEFTLTPPPAR